VNVQAQTPPVAQDVPERARDAANLAGRTSHTSSWRCSSKNVVTSASLIWISARRLMPVDVSRTVMVTVAVLVAAGKPGRVDGQVLAVVLLTVRKGLGVQRERRGAVRQSVAMPKSLSLLMTSVRPWSVVATPSTLSWPKKPPVGSSPVSSPPRSTSSDLVTGVMPAFARSAVAVAVSSVPT